MGKIRFLPFAHYSDRAKMKSKSCSSSYQQHLIREKELTTLGDYLEFPLWEKDFAELLKDLDASGIEIIVSASTTPRIEVGEESNLFFSQK